MESEEKENMSMVEVWFEGFPPPPQKLRMKVKRIVYRKCKKGDFFLAGIHQNATWKWSLYDSSIPSCVNFVVEYEPLPILCPECGVPMRVYGLKESGFWLKCNETGYHWTTPIEPTEEQAIATAEPLRGLWEKKNRKE